MLDKLNGLNGAEFTKQYDKDQGSMHRAWTNIKATITGKSEHAVLAECERGEDAAKAAYEAALQKSLPADVRALVERQHEGVKANHDRVRNLRNAAA